MMSNGTPRPPARHLALVLAAAACGACKGPPARLVAGAADTVVVNNRRPVRIPTRVFDAAGHVLPNTGVRYRWASGAPVPVSADGVVTCTRRGDAVLRASLDPLATRVVLQCRPVREVWPTMPSGFMLGDSARALTIAAVGVDGRPVDELAARVRIADSTVATLEHARDGLRVRPLRPGWTSIYVDVGDQRTGTRVMVFEAVRTFEGLRPDQRWVVAPIRLARGEVKRWPLPVGLFFLAVGPGTTAPTTRAFSAGPTAQATPSVRVDGPIMCMPALRPGVVDTHCLARAPGATLTLAHPGPGAPAEVVAMLALERQEQR